MTAGTSLSRALCVSPLLSVLPVFDSFLNKIKFGGLIWRRRLTTHRLLRRRNRLGSILLARCCPQGRRLLSGRARACQARGYAYASDLRVCISAALRARQQPCCVCIIPGYFQTLFPSTRAPPSAPLLATSLRQREPRARRRLFVLPAPRPRIVESNRFLAGMSAAIKVSPVGGVMLLKGFACLLEVGSGSTLGCHMRQNGSECQ